MNCRPFWNKVPDTDKLSLSKAQTLYPEQIKTWLEREEIEPGDEDEQDEFNKLAIAYTVEPNLGPAGLTTDADEESFADYPEDEDIPDEMIGPSLSGDKSLMIYKGFADELYLWNNRENDWIMWNY
jgi:hypothetical protein